MGVELAQGEQRLAALAKLHKLLDLQRDLSWGFLISEASPRGKLLMLTLKSDHWDHCFINACRLPFEIYRDSVRSPT
jgi:hypothetical protein